LHRITVNTQEEELAIKRIKFEAKNKNKKNKDEEAEFKFPDNYVFHPKDIEAPNEAIEEVYK
jgi:hypothetical protein